MSQGRGLQVAVAPSGMRGKGMGGKSGGRDEDEEGAGQGRLWGAELHKAGAGAVVGGGAAAQGRGALRGRSLEVWN